MKQKPERQRVTKTQSTSIFRNRVSLEMAKHVVAQQLAASTQEQHGSPAAAHGLLAGLAERF